MANYMLDFEGDADKCFLSKKKKKKTSTWELGMTFHTTGEGNGTPLQYSCLENPMDGGAW